jgi:hypothetical protein
MSVSSCCGHTIFLSVPLAFWHFGGQFIQGIYFANGHEYDIHVRHYETVCNVYLRTHNRQNRKKHQKSQWPFFLFQTSLILLSRKGKNPTIHLVHTSCFFILFPMFHRQYWSLSLLIFSMDRGKCIVNPQTYYIKTPTVLINSLKLLSLVEWTELPVLSLISIFRFFLMGLVFWTQHFMLPK